MIAKFKEKLGRTAELVVRVGINVQRGDEVVIGADIGAAELVRALVARSYEAGARDVAVLWSDDVTARMRYEKADGAAIASVPEWLAAARNEAAEKKKCYIGVVSGDPFAFEGVDPERVAAASRAMHAACAPFYRASSVNDIRWCVCACATPAWAKRVYPALGEKQATEKLWQAIFRAMRVDRADPVKAWLQHGKKLEKRCRHLNRCRFVSLEYRSGAGTDLVAELPENYVFTGGFERCADGVTFAANMPTEEIFSAPLREGVNGKLVATMPLSHGGRVAENFWFRFEKGRVAEYGAEKGKEVLDGILAADEGAKYLGEIALVPYDSAIRGMNILFYNTLFDENASCHFALGRAYASVKGAEKMTEQEQLAAGLNQSAEHVDFMVGTEDLEIIGNFPDGNREVIMRKGNFVI